MVSCTMSTRVLIIWVYLELILYNIILISLSFCFSLKTFVVLLFTQNMVPYRFQKSSKDPSYECPVPSHLTV